MDSPELAIRAQRAAFNRALANADIAAIKSFLATNALLVAGTDSAVLAGRNAQLQAWKHEFAASDRRIYQRSPIGSNYRQSMLSPWSTANGPA